jgi:coenzyme F420 hydrogenase subunit beta
MPFSDLKNEILDQDMCTRCGACVAVCPPGWLAIGENSTPVPAIKLEAMECGECSLCLDVCPGKDTGTPSSEINIFGRSRTPAERWTGIFRQSLVLASTDPKVLTGAAAGGAGTTLMLTALRSGLADAVIVVGRDADRPWVPAALITDSEDEVIRCGQTSYCLTPNLQLLRDPRFSRIALIGVPCEVQAVRKMQNLVPLPEAAEKIVLAVEIACASSTRLAGTEHLITEKLGVALEDVVEMRYRDGEYPGEFAVKTRDGQRRALPFFEVVDEFKRFKQSKRGQAAPAIDRDDANRGRRENRAGGGSTRPRHRHAQGLCQRGESWAATEAFSLCLLCRGDAQPGAVAPGRV